ncbi:hypothetical protein BH11ACT6_BH11ACT6_24330 [soil metagenome]
MTTAILRPQPFLGAVEAMNLRDSFKQVLENGGTGVVVDLTGVQDLSAAGLAAVTNLLAQGRRTGIPVRVLMPEDGSAAARVIDQADLGRFLAPAGLWHTPPTGSVGPGSSRSGRRAWSLRHPQGVLRRKGYRTGWRGAQTDASRHQHLAAS